MENKLLLKKKRSITANKLTALRAREKQLRADETALMEQLEAVEDEIPADLEQKIDELNKQQAEVADQIGELVDQLQELDDTLAQVDEALEDPESNNSRSSGTPAAKRTAASAGAFRCRSKCFAGRAQRDAFYAAPAVKSFLQRVRTQLPASRRGVTGADLTIPQEILDVLRDNLHQYSKLISRIRLRQVSGHARQHIIGKVPEGVWMEMAGALNDLEFAITDIETDGYKVGGVIVIDNYLLKDSDIALGEEILYMLGQSIGLALDKAIVFGKGPNSHMPVGIVTRLAQTAQPGYWGDDQGTWTDLHSSNVLQLNLASQEGTAFFIPFLTGAAKAKPTYDANGKIWICNDATRQDILIRSLAYNSNAALVAGMENQMPVIGGEFVTLEFMPDKMVVGGYGAEYLLAEREGGTFGSSDLPLYIQDKTVFKGTARYDGQPISGEAWVAMTYDNSSVTTSMDFSKDYANTSPNALVVTSAAGSASGDTVLTVAGAVSASNALKAFVGAPAPISKGDKPGKDWLAIVSGTTAVTAATGSGVTVVELDDAGKVISIGYCASVTAKA